MKSAILSLLALAAGSATAFTPQTLPGALAPVGFFDPLGFAEKADPATLKRYREAELTHGRVRKYNILSREKLEVVEN